jgi:hypothetical protein
VLAVPIGRTGFINPDAPLVFDCSGGNSRLSHSVSDVEGGIFFSVPQLENPKGAIGGSVTGVLMLSHSIFWGSLFGTHDRVERESAMGIFRLHSGAGLSVVSACRLLCPPLSHNGQVRDGAIAGQCCFLFPRKGL